MNPLPRQQTSDDSKRWRQTAGGWQAPFDRALRQVDPSTAHPCNCIGPQNGDPVCPCQMRGVSIRNGRYVRVTDLGPAPAADDSASD